MSIARGGRLTAAVDLAMQALNQSVEVDKRLWPDDIRGSSVHARALARAGIISAEEADTLVRGLALVQGEIERGEMKWDPVREDVHMNIESRLTELVGTVGGKLHTARSRNDQVATDLRLWTRRHIDEAVECVRDFCVILCDRAEEQLDVLMPAYTHLQRAQPSRLAHHLMAWHALLQRDLDRLLDARRRVNECPLGAGAVAGSGFALDREWVSSELGFDRPMTNSIDATGSRDFLMEVASSLAILGVHLSRIGEELVIWSSYEFGFVTLSDAFSTSSSMMPQKKNPDVAELVRGKAARLIGEANQLLILEKSLCFGYGRDLQEDKRPIFDAFDNALQCLRALGGAVATCAFNRVKLEGALSGGHLCATDLADFLVTCGVPFRQAHHIVGQAVRSAEERGVQLGELDEATLEALHPALKDPEVRAALDPKQAVERRQLIGGPARVRVVEAIETARRHWAAFDAAHAG